MLLVTLIFGRVLKSLIERHPSLSTLFLSGQRASNPFKIIKVREEEKSFEGKRYPTYFRFKGKNNGVELHRDCHINMRCRIAFETDAFNDYFSRGVDPGKFSLYMVANGSSSPVESHILNLQNGIATLSLQLPANCREGDTLHFRAIVSDPSRIEPFVNIFAVHVKKATESASGNGKRHKPPAKEEGKDRELPSGIQLPPLTRVYESDWQNHRPPFDHYTALRIKHAGSSEETDDDNEQNIYDFSINMDNQYLKRYLKYELKSGQDERVVQTRFEIGLVLVGLALLQNHNSVQKEKETADMEQEEKKETNIEDQVADITKALALFLLPMIDSLGDLDLEDNPGMESSGEVI